MSLKNIYIFKKRIRAKKKNGYYTKYKWIKQSEVADMNEIALTLSLIVRIIPA